MTQIEGGAENVEAQAVGTSETHLEGSPWARLPFHAVVVAVLLGLSSLAILRYRSGRSDWAFDLAFFHNLVFNAAAGNGFVQSASTHELPGLLNLSHAFLVLPVIVPFYRIFPQLETLLTIQTAALVLGAYPVARLARAKGATTPTSWLCVALYLSCFPLWRLGLTDFRPLVLSVLPLLWLAVGLASGRVALAMCAGLAACLTREEVPLLVAAMAGMYLVFAPASRRAAAPTLALACGYFLLQLWIRPRAGYYVPFLQPETLIGSLHWEAGGDISRLRQARHIGEYLGLGFWPALMAPLTIAAALPLLAYQFLANQHEWWVWHGPYVHHCAPLLAIFAAGAASGWAKLEHVTRRMSPHAPWVLWSIMFLSLVLQGALARTEIARTMGFLDGDAVIQKRQESQRELEALMALVPEDARVATDYRLIARLSGRRWLYCYQANFSLEAGSDEDRGEARGPGMSDVDWMLVLKDHLEWLEALDQRPDWRLRASGGGYRLYGREGGGP